MSAKPSPSVTAVHALRDVLIASYRAARMRAAVTGELVLNPASRAGQLLLEHDGDVSAALGREQGTSDDFGLHCRTYLRTVICEERRRGHIHNETESRSNVDGHSE